MDAAATCEDVPTRLLLMMQSGCSPSARQMASEARRCSRFSSFHRFIRWELIQKKGIGSWVEKKVGLGKPNKMKEGEGKSQTPRWARQGRAAGSSNH
ncbi:hypothetical protein EJB05_21601, partial [Eragrostis curvula]